MFLAATQVQNWNHCHGMTFFTSRLRKLDGTRQPKGGGIVKVCHLSPRHGSLSRLPYFTRASFGPSGCLWSTLGAVWVKIGPFLG